MTTASDTWSAGDHQHPYKAYSVSTQLLVNVGGIQMPLAYKNVQGQTYPTSRLFQMAEPTAIIVVEWWGQRVGAKPEPPRVVTTGSFVLASAGGKCIGPTKDAQIQDILEASGYLVMYTATRPELLVIPAFWCPYDDRYDQPTTPMYTYTAQELGFGNLLPGQDSGVVRKPNNPPPQQQFQGIKTIL